MSTTPATKRGSNRTPAGQAYSVRPSRQIKRATEAFKRLTGVSRLSPTQRSMVAYLTIPQGRDTN